MGERAFNPNLIVPAGTEVVARIPVRTIGAEQTLPKGAVGVVVQSPTDNSHAYRVRFPDASEAMLKRQEIAVLKHVQRWGLERVGGVLEADMRNRGAIKMKHAMHLIRLLLAGIRTLREGAVPVDVGAYRDQLLAIRRGEIEWGEINHWRRELHREFDDAYETTTLPERPDYDRADAFLIRARRSMVKCELIMMESDDILRQVAAEHAYPLLFATVSGAHLYGFSSADSDYDLRGAHIRPVKEVMGLEPGAETVQSSHVRDGIEVDLVTHDVGKFFRLLLRPNGYVLEQLYSPLVVVATREYEELRETLNDLTIRLRLATMSEDA